MNSTRRDALIERSIGSHSVKTEGNYTIPRTYGVYRLPVTRERGREYRFGNHPVRQHELVRDYGAARLEALFTDRVDAVELAALLNRG